MNLQIEFTRAFGRMLWLAVFFAAFNFADARAQNVRLRAHRDPAVSQFRLKYSDITADGNLAVMGGYAARGAFVFDISNPDAPVLKSIYNPGNNLQLLEAVVVGNRGYFGVGGTFASVNSEFPNRNLGDGVHIVDLSNPANPVLLGKVNASSGSGYNTVHEIVVDGNYLYENSNLTGNVAVKVIDVSNPAQPRHVRDITTNNNGWVHAFFVKNGKMYTSGFFGGGLTEIYNVSNIETGVNLLGQVQSGGSSHSSWTSEDGNYLYVCREFVDGDLRVYDIRNLAQPLLVKVIKAGDLGINGVTPHNPVVKGNLLFVAWYQAGTQIFDISAPENPRRVGQFDTYAPAFSESAARKEMTLAGVDPADAVCGIDRVSGQALPTTYEGNWTAYPVLGLDKVLVADLNSGLYVLDASRVTLAPRNNAADFDGDRKTDFSTYTRSNGLWTIEASGNSAVTQTFFGVASDKLAAHDWDGDGRTDIAVFRDGNWYILHSANNSFRAIGFGTAGDVPVAADYDGDFKADAAVFRPSSGVWFVQRSTEGFYAAGWGANGDEPVAGDFDGDNKADLTVARNTNGFKYWYSLPSSSSIPQSYQFGVAADKPVVADFDGDLRTDIAVYRPANGNWFILNPRTNAVSGAQFGVETDAPVPADYDGDGRAEIAVYRPSNRVWYFFRTSDNSFVGRQFGANGDLPAPCAAQSQANNGCQIP